MKKIYQNKLLLSFLLCFILGSILILPNMILGKGIFSLIADYNQQQVPFLILMNNAIKSGSFNWTWLNDLGSNFIGTYSFYNLFSPFSIISYLFPSSFIPYLNGLLIILKFGIGGLCSYLFLKRYVKNKDNAVVGSLIYTFSGFVLTNILFHFQDIIMLFPLVLYSLDRLVYDNKKYIFALSIALMALTNWFLFIGICVFIILYFLIKVICREYIITWKKFFNIVFEGVIGLLLGSLVLIPTMLFMISNPRVGGSWEFIKMFIYPNCGSYVELLRAFLFPPLTMAYRAFLWDSNYRSAEIYLPVVGILFCIGYILKNPKKWDSVLIIVCLLFAGIPILNSSFFLFNTNYYARWFYMLSLIMTLVSIKYLDSKNDNIKISLIINSSLYLVFFICVCLYCFIIKSIDIFHNPIYCVSCLLISVFSLLFSYYIYKSKKRFLYLVISIFIYVGLFGNYMIYTYKDSFSYDENFYNYLNIGNNISIDEDVRTNSDISCYPNISSVTNIKNIYSFNSNISGSSFKFYNSIGYFRDVTTLVNDDSLNDLLGVKYIISCKDGEYNISENDNYKSIGYIAEDYILEEDFLKLDYPSRITTLLDKVVINKSLYKKVNNLFGVDYTNDFKFTNDGFTDLVKTEKEAFITYSVPYDSGWEAYVNGKEVSIEEVNNGFMGIILNSGVNKVVFSYKTPGLKLGIGCFILGCFTMIGYIIFNKKCIK